MKRKAIPKHIGDHHGFCGQCGGWNDIVHLSELDQATRVMFQLMFQVKNGWIISCEDCENLGALKEEEA
jgi:hypothetical protein